jgi:aspartokinase-like uncharacterized kinase
MIVVKIGGSLYDSPELEDWMRALTNYSKQETIVIVPGGGPFCDQVRHAQQHHNLHDKSAHHMAILAMKQFGLLLADIAPTCHILNTLTPTPPPLSIWLPDDSILLEPTLSHNWTITSDSIALWLAAKLGAKQLILVKSAPTNTASITQLTIDTIIDTGFQTLFNNIDVHTCIMHADQSCHFENYRHLPRLSLP